MTFILRNKVFLLWVAPYALLGTYDTMHAANIAMTEYMNMPSMSKGEYYVTEVYVQTSYTQKKKAHESNS